MSEIVDAHEHGTAPTPTIDAQLESQLDHQPELVSELGAGATIEATIDASSIEDPVDREGERGDAEPEDAEPEYTESGLDLDVDPEVNPDVDIDVDIEPELDVGLIAARAQVYLKTIAGRVLVILPPPIAQPDSVAEATWQELQQQLSQRLNAGERLWPMEARVTLIAGDRELDNAQLQDLEDILADHQLGLSRVQTRRRETAIAAATAGYSVEQQALPSGLATPGAIDSGITTPGATAPPIALAEPLYIQTTVRSGIEVRHPGTVIVFGDVNPGGSVIAEGDIVIWGKLRGLVHAGANGNFQAIVAALQMEPTQVRIADTVARVTSQNLDRFHPEVAYATRQGIRLRRAEDFSRSIIPKS